MLQQGPSRTLASKPASSPLFSNFPSRSITMCSLPTEKLAGTPIPGCRGRMPTPAHQRPRSNTALLPGISNRFPMTRNHSCPADQKSPAGKSKASYKLLVYGFCDTRRNRPLVYTYYITNTADDLCQRLVNCCMRLKSSASQDIHKDRRRSPIPITGVISYM